MSHARRLSVGRALRRHNLSARILTEYRIARLRRGTSQPELRLACELAQSGTTVVDVGASVGNYAVALSKAVGRKGQVLALEPHPRVYKELVHSTWLTNVTALRAAASDRTGSARLHVPRDDSGSDVFPLGSLEHSDLPGNQVPVETVRLDDVLEGHSVSLIKIDVEGHELNAILGAAATIQAQHPTLLVEIEQRHLRDKTVAEVVDRVASFGYDCAAIAPEGLVPWRAFDIEARQTNLVNSDGSMSAAVATQYVNNFLFSAS